MNGLFGLSIDTTAQLLVAFGTLTLAATTVFLWLTGERQRRDAARPLLQIRADANKMIVVNRGPGIAYGVLVVGHAIDSRSADESTGSADAGDGQTAQRVNEIAGARQPDRWFYKMLTALAVGQTEDITATQTKPPIDATLEKGEYRAYCTDFFGRWRAFTDAGDRQISAAALQSRTELNEFARRSNLHSPRLRFTQILGRRVGGGAIVIGAALAFAGATTAADVATGEPVRFVEGADRPAPQFTLAPNSQPGFGDPCDARVSLDAPSRSCRMVAIFENTGGRGVALARLAVQYTVGNRNDNAACEAVVPPVDTGAYAEVNCVVQLPPESVVSEKPVAEIVPGSGRPA